MPYRQTQRSKARKQEKRNAILEAALRLFSARGFEATGMRDIAAEAHTSIGNCYFYFRDKEAVLLAVVDESIEAVSTVADAAAREHQSKGPVAQARAMVETGMQEALRRPRATGLLLSQATRQAVRERIRRHFTARTARFFAAHPELTGGKSPTLVATAWQGVILNVLEARLAGELDESADALATFVADWNLGAIGHGPAAIG